MYWKDDVAMLAKKLATDSKNGLTSKEVQTRIANNGYNQLPTMKTKSWWKIILLNLVEPFMFILFTLLAILAFLNEWAEFIVVILIILLELMIATYQEFKVNTSLAAIKKLVTNEAVVIRDGEKITVDVKNLVVGDLVVLEAGMFVPADLRIIQAFNLRTNEALLTGESNLIFKTDKIITKTDLALGDQKNMAFMSTMVVTGSGLGIITAVASNTEIGKINTLLQEQKSQKTPLTKEINSLLRIISAFAILLATAIFLVQCYLNETSWQKALIFAIALVIAVIPEGLILVVSACLSLGSRRMAKKHAIIKKLASVETLGQVNVICSDKTGTLTENKMTVKNYYLDQTVHNADTYLLTTRQEQLFLLSLVLANNGIVNNEKIIGDPTETSLLEWAASLKMEPTKIQSDYQRRHELPFDSERKLMSTIVDYEHDQYLFTKGAADKLLDHCSYVLINETIVALTEQKKAEILLNLQIMTNKALRVLGASFRIINDHDDFNNVATMESNLVFLGLVGMIDPPRKEVKTALAAIKSAGIKTKMITGDHINTAVAIAKDLALITSSAEAITGAELDQIDDKTFSQTVNNYQVFARVLPEHKVRIVKNLQKSGNIVAMTGDGVNDAPSLKAADIGIAMGITGTDVAKDAAALILTDDNFLTIIEAVEEGRNIYQKLKQIICFILITNLAQVLTFIITTLFPGNNAVFLTALQVLWINLIVESILAITMSTGPNNPRLMRQKLPLKRHNILHKSWFYIIVTSIMLSLFTFFSLKFLPSLLQTDLNNGVIYGFVVIVNAPIFYAMYFLPATKHNFLQNRIFLIAVVVCFFLNMMIVFVPFVAKTFKLKGQISFSEWIICLIIALIPTLVLIFYRFLNAKIRKLISNSKIEHKNKIT